jgi:hypothetical protein
MCLNRVNMQRGALAFVLVTAAVVMNLFGSSPDEKDGAGASPAKTSIWVFDGGRISDVEDLRKNTRHLAEFAADGSGTDKTKAYVDRVLRELDACHLLIMDNITVAGRGRGNPSFADRDAPQCVIYRKRLPDGDGKRSEKEKESPWISVTVEAVSSIDPNDENEKNFVLQVKVRAERSVKGESEKGWVAADLIHVKLRAADGREAIPYPTNKGEIK